MFRQGRREWFSYAKKNLHKRSAASAGECFEAAFFRSGFVQPLSFNCFTDFVFWVQFTLHDRPTDRPTDRNYGVRFGFVKYLRLSVCDLC